MGNHTLKVGDELVCIVGGVTEGGYEVFPGKVESVTETEAILESGTILEVNFSVSKDGRAVYNEVEKREPVKRITAGTMPPQRKKKYAWELVTDEVKERIHAMELTFGLRSWFRSQRFTDEQIKAIYNMFNEGNEIA